MTNKVENGSDLSTDGVYKAYVQSAYNYLRQKQTQFLDSFKVKDFEKWRWDQSAGTMLFSSTRQLQLEAQIHVAGTWSPQSHIWEWAWANQKLGVKVKLASQGIRHLGEAFKFKPLTTGHWVASEKDCWKMTAVLVKEINAIGASSKPLRRKTTFS